MKEKPILFSAPMVRAILEGRKTQTRRVVKPQPVDGQHEFRISLSEYVAGRLMWVRETWQYANWTEDGEPYIGYAADDSRILMRDAPDEWHERNCEIWEQLSAPENYNIDGRAADRRWRPSIHMPRWASRITLEIVSVRVERLRDISNTDAMAEGCPEDRIDNLGSPETWFRLLWESINGAGSWEANPLVWVITFKRIHP